MLKINGFYIILHDKGINKRGKLNISLPPVMAFAI